MDDNTSLQEVAQEFAARSNLQFRKKVGEGAFKETFEVLDSAGNPVALKVYKPGASAMRSARELAAMKKCNHPNIARLLGAYTHELNGDKFVVTLEEFLKGGTLTSRGKLDIESVWRIGSQLCGGIAHIAKQGLVHRDLKPDNIMFRADSVTPVIVDFGVVRVLTDTSLTPTWAPRGPGTPFYSSPEQLNNEKHQIDWRSDEFSLGVVLAEAAFGVHPYHLAGITEYDVVSRVSARQAPSESFKEDAKNCGLSALPTMIAPWSVQRFRTPDHLIEAWDNQVPTSRATPAAPSSR